MDKGKRKMIKLPYMKSLLDITYEHAIEVCKIIYPMAFINSKRWKLERYTHQKAGGDGLRLLSRSSTIYFEIDVDGELSCINKDGQHPLFEVSSLDIRAAYERLDELGYDTRNLIQQGKAIKIQ